MKPEKDHALNDDVPVKAECIHMLGCTCGQVRTHSIRGDFCGQQQPHGPHVWTNLIPFRSTQIATPRQCAGLSTPPASSTTEGARG